MVIDTERFIQLYPRLYHMAAPDCWDGVRTHGLLSTSALLDLFEVGGEFRDSIESQRRPQTVAITHEKHGGAHIRDQIPMSDSALRKCLVDMNPADWYRLLNSKVFFWPTRERLLGLLSARAYRSSSQTIFTVDTAGLVAMHREAIWLSPINSGSTIYNPQARGSNTFVRLADYDYDSSKKKRGHARAIAEVAVEHGIPDITEILVSVELRSPDGTIKGIWAR